MKMLFMLCFREPYAMSPTEYQKQYRTPIFRDSGDHGVGHGSGAYLRRPAEIYSLPAGVKRYTFSPDAAYAKELEALADPDEIPDPPCGDWGEMPDGIQYFEVPAGDGQKLLFVRVGQDEPLFDEQTLQVLPAG